MVNAGARRLLFVSLIDLGHRKRMTLFQGGESEVKADFRLASVDVLRCLYLSRPQPQCPESPDYIRQLSLYRKRYVHSGERIG